MHRHRVVHVAVVVTVRRGVGRLMCGPLGGLPGSKRRAVGRQGGHRWQVEQSVRRRWLSRCAARASAPACAGGGTAGAPSRTPARGGRRCGAGSRWQSRHHCICSGWARHSMRHLVDAPVALDAGHALGDVHAVVEVDEVRQHVHALPRRSAGRVAALSCSWASSGWSRKSCEWQPRQTPVDGRPAWASVSTVVWQYRQSMPSSPTWCLWLNGIGWAIGSPSCS